MKKNTKFWGYIILIMIISIGAVLVFIFKVENRTNNESYIANNSNLESNIAIMVQDIETKEYLKQDSIPMGNYMLNLEKTRCASQGVIRNYDAVNGTIKFEAGAADECYLYFDVATYNNAQDFINNVYVSQEADVGNGKLYLHDSTLANGAGDNSYRFAGKDPNNYICFEGDDCTNENNLYRIIGIIDGRIKVVKYLSTTKSAFNSNASINKWENSTMDTYLNQTWLATLGDKADFIDYTDWKVGGLAWNIARTTKQYYDEIQADTVIISRKIGLIYPYDYGYAAIKDNWTTRLFSYKISMDDYLVATGDYWTMLPRTDGSGNLRAYIINASVGYGCDNAVTFSAEVKPVFFLKNNAKITINTGAKTNPHIISKTN